MSGRKELETDLRNEHSETGRDREGNVCDSAVFKNKCIVPRGFMVYF